MMRLALALLVLAAAILAVQAVGAVRAGGGRSAGPRPQERGDTMPDTIRTIAYVLLFLLMLGVTAGWLGGA